MHWGRVAAVLLSRATPARTAAAAGRPTRATWRSTDAMLTRQRFFSLRANAPVDTLEQREQPACAALVLLQASEPRAYTGAGRAVCAGRQQRPRATRSPRATSCHRVSSGKFTLLSALQDAATAPPAGTPRRRSAAAPAGGRDRSRQHGTGRRGVARARRSRRRRLRRGRSPDPPTAIDHHGGGLRRGRVPARRRGPPEPAARGRRARGRRRPPGGAPAARPELCGNQNFTARSC